MYSWKVEKQNAKRKEGAGKQTTHPLYNSGIPFTVLYPFLFTIALLANLILLYSIYYPMAPRKSH